MTIYRNYSDGELRRLLSVGGQHEDNQLMLEALQRYLGNQSDTERIAELEKEIDDLEKRDAVPFDEYEEVCNERDDLQLQVDTLTATFDALVNT